MFCPGCGSEQQQSGQFCRACGTDLRAVRISVERPDAITASAVSAREEIGRAIAEKIREMEDSHDIKRVVEDVLPQIEKFLESPAQKRLRRFRAGTIIGSGGLGVVLLGMIISAVEHGALPVVGAGLLVLSVGIGFVINALLFTIPHGKIAGDSREAEGQETLDGAGTPLSLRQPSAGSRVSTNELAARRSGGSVTESTTRLLDDKR
jgi:hypothetical protein